MPNLPNSTRDRTRKRTMNRKISGTYTSFNILCAKSIKPYETAYKAVCCFVWNRNALKQKKSARKTIKSVPIGIIIYIKLRTLHEL